jgi:hypothetical protein
VIRNRSFKVSFHAARIMQSVFSPAARRRSFGLSV